MRDGMRRRMPRRVRERVARREVDELRGRVLGHWAAVGIDEEWTEHRDSFFLESARKRWFL